jgi:hypothetical protein
MRTEQEIRDAIWRGDYWAARRDTAKTALPGELLEWRARRRALLWVLASADEGGT